MNVFEVRRLSSMLDSLTQSTFVEVISGLLVATWHGRTSPLVSHRSVSFETRLQDAMPAAVRLDNGKHCLWIEPAWEPESRPVPEAGYVWVDAEVPTAWLLREELVLLLGQSGAEAARRLLVSSLAESRPLIRVAWQERRVIGWAPDGPAARRPVFEGEEPPERLEKELVPTRDAGWHYVDSPHRVGCAAGQKGWYTAITPAPPEEEWPAEVREFASRHGVATRSWENVLYVYVVSD